MPFLESAFADRVTTTGTSDVRDLAVDDTARRRCEEACGGALECLAECTGVSLDVYLSNSLPASLLMGHTTSMRQGEVQNDRLQISAAIALDIGAGRVVIGDVIDLSGQPARRVFVASFETRTLTIYDPGAGAIEARILTGRGPSAVAVDSTNALAYVTHFTDSYIGVVDLDKRHATFGTIIRALGEPTPPRGD